MNLLVTGGAGFIGANLIEHVIDRGEVARLVNIDCLTYAAHPGNLEKVVSHPKYTFERVDLCDADDVSRVVREQAITHVLHLAAETHVDRSISDPCLFARSNYLGTVHLLEACRKGWQGSFDGKRFHHVSTDEVYGSLGPEGMFTETSPYAPSSPYSASKAGADMMVRAYHRTYGMPVVLSNCANNFGPYQHQEKLIPVIIGSVLARRRIPLFGDGQQVRDWLYVRDHAEALWMVLTRGRAGETYNIGAHNEWPNRKLTEMICDIVDELDPSLGGNSRELISLVADRPGHDRRYAIDATKLMRALGWKPRWEFESALRQTVQWYLEHPDRLREPA